MGKLPMFGQIKPHWCPCWVKCPVSGITNSLCTYRQNCPSMWEVPPTTPPPPKLKIYLGWSLQNHQLGSSFGQCKHIFHNTIFSFEIWEVVGKLPMFGQIKPHWCPSWIKLRHIGKRTQQYISKIWSWYQKRLFTTVQFGSQMSIEWRNQITSSIDKTVHPGVSAPTTPKI